MKRYAFIHVPKTAGISFLRGFQSAFGATNVSMHILDSRLSESTVRNLKVYRVISGHLSYGDLAEFFPHYIWITVLREPVDRALSQYFHYRTIANPNDVGPKLALQYDLDAYFHLPVELLGATSNRAVYQLGAHVMDASIDFDAALKTAKRTLRRCSWVGIYENLSLYVENLRRTLPDFANFVLPREHVTPARVSAQEISPTLRARIITLNAYDMQLYEWARRMFAP